MILNKAATLTKGFAAALLGTFFLTSCDQLGDLDGVIPGGGSGGGGNSQMKMYKVQLNPLNNSGVTGTATVMMNEDGEFEVITDVMGLAPSMVHPQHIHGFVMENMADKDAMCPPPSAAGADGLLTLEDGLPFYGPVLIPLDDKLVPLTADNFPIATSAGTISYGGKVMTSSLVSAFDAMHNGTQTEKDLELDKRVIVIHGAYVYYDKVVPADSREAKWAEYQPTLPVACGELVEMK
ncbi:hypothetical protein DXT99_12150 [Pontibacter diazotrophicus]|uniref:CHRD domain-containing protein n=2 Tax=Pontibacter diazotrophicus TaxID=1400979 RepID=A0A3D8LC99_9BACT|nr:hypothetical protein DXT99_12150 [Pontibacter diazotrophicus]